MAVYCTNIIIYNTDVNDLSPQLNPYPDWKSNNLSSRFLISTYRINVDICDRLWTIDTGSIVDFDGNGERIHTPRIRVFNLKNNSLIFEYILKTQDYVCDSSYTSIIADVGDTCERTFAYAVDPGSNALLVYSLEQNDSWRIRHPYFNPDPMQTEYKIGDLEFQWDDGIFGLALGEKISSGFRNVYIHAMSNLLELSMSTQLLQNKTASSKFSKKFLKILGSRSPTYQAAASAYDERSGILFYTLVNKNGIGCWNSKKYNYYAQNVTDVAAVDNISLVYSSDVKIDKISNLWLISNRLPFLLYKEDKVSNEVKFRIFTSPVRQVVKNTACEHNRFFWSRKI